MNIQSHIPLIGVIEDDSDLQTILRYFLQEHMMDALPFNDAETAWRHIQNPRSSRPDLWIVDIMLPGLWDGLDFIRSLRMLPYGKSVPILVLTARGREQDIVIGLESGADDYIVKPYRPRELIARIKTLLRRSGVPSNQNTAKSLKWGELEVDLEYHTVRVGHRIIPLTHSERIIFEHLVRSQGRIFSREELMSILKSEDHESSPRTIDVHIRHIRQKLGVYSKWLVTVRYEGYTWRPTDQESLESHSPDTSVP